MSSLTSRDYSVVRPPCPRHCWTDNEMRILIRERTRRNHEYWYNYPDQNRSQLWNSIASTVNSTCNSSYTSMQCSNKFQSLKTEYYVSKKKYIHILQCVTKKTGFFNFLYKYLFKLYKILKIYVNF